MPACCLIVSQFGWADGGPVPAGSPPRAAPADRSRLRSLHVAPELARAGE